MYKRQAIGGVIRVEGKAEQAALAASAHHLGQIEKRRRGHRAIREDNDSSRLLERLTPALEAGPGAADPERLAVLTEREREVMSAVARGLSNTEIAATLYLAEATVKTLSLIHI